MHRKNKKRENMMKKSLAVTLSLLIISLSFSFAFLTSVPYAKAEERYGCCRKTTNNNYCTETYESQCSANEFLGGACTDTNNAECRLVTCNVGNDCMLNVPKDKCINEDNGRVAMGDECSKLCCGIAGRSYGIITKSYCKSLAFEKGFDNSYVEFFNTQDELECSQHFEPSTKGCCITSEQCLYTTRQECSAEFHEVSCSDIPERCDVQEIGLRCGKPGLGNENNVVLLDSAGDEKIDRTCNNPAFQCVQCMNETCRDEQYTTPQKIASQFEGYCASTSCTLEGIGQQQKIKIENGKLDLEAVNVVSTNLLNGQSICFNFFGADDKENNGGAEDIKHMAGRSTGLQNHKLVCNYGKVEIIGLATDRRVLCQDDVSTYITKKITNVDNANKCHECAGSGVLNFVGDFIYPGAMSGIIVNLFPEQCTESMCSDIKSPEGESLCYYQKDFNRITITKNNKVGSCVPKYPLGNTDSCGECGKGGDGTWNICDESEAYALGNCQFKPASELEKTGIFTISWAGLYLANRMGMSPIEAGILTVIDCVKTPSPFCFVTYPFHLVATVGDAVNDIIWFVNNVILYKAKEILKDAFGGLAGTFGKIINFFKGK